MEIIKNNIRNREIENHNYLKLKNFLSTDWGYFVIKFKPDSRQNLYTAKAYTPQDLSKDCRNQTRIVKRKIIKNINNKNARLHRRGKAPLKAKFTYDNLRFVGIIEYSSLITRDGNFWHSFPENLHLGVHIHYFFTNSTNYADLRIYDQFKSLNQGTNFGNSISSYSEYRDQNYIYSSVNKFIGYHIKQPLDKSLMFDA